jgi:hypothetical protein
MANYDQQSEQWLADQAQALRAGRSKMWPRLVAATKALSGSGTALGIGQNFSTDSL